MKGVAATVPTIITCAATNWFALTAVVAVGCSSSDPSATPAAGCAVALEDATGKSFGDFTASGGKGFVAMKERAPVGASTAFVEASQRCARDHAQRLGCQLGESFAVGNMFIATCTAAAFGELARRSDVLSVSAHSGGAPPP
jgi:hypothetical protein